MHAHQCLVKCQRASSALFAQSAPNPDYCQGRYAQYQPRAHPTCKNGHCLCVLSVCPSASTLLPRSPPAACSPWREVLLGRAQACGSVDALPPTFPVPAQPSPFLPSATVLPGTATLHTPEVQSASLSCSSVPFHTLVQLPQHTQHPHCW